MSSNDTKIKLIILDIDGVLTDGKIIYTSAGEELKVFNAKDGFAVKHIGPENGIEFAIITGSSCPTVVRRAGFLNIQHIYTDSFEKAAAYQKIKSDLGLTDNQIAYMGDDWFDWPAMRFAGYKGAPADAAPEIIERADFVASAKGGNGAVREFIVEIVKRNGNYDAAISRYFK